MEEPASEERDAKLSSHESKLWAKKGVFGKKGVLQDIMCVAFGPDGITYAGTADGHIYRFAEQTMDLAVKVRANPNPNPNPHPHPNPNPNPHPHPHPNQVSFTYKVFAVGGADGFEPGSS